VVKLTTPNVLTLGKEIPVPTKQEAAWAPEWVRRSRKR